MPPPTGPSSAKPGQRIPVSALREFLRYNLPAGFTGLLILVLTLVPGAVLPEIPTFLDLFKPDKLLHVAMFGVYLFLQARGFERQPAAPWWSRHAVAMAWLFALVLALSTELLQACLIPLRTGSVPDVVANVMGCAAGWGLYRRFRRPVPH